jgi:photosystem II stability/assembly factor-like uncharacterized protein
MTYLNRRRNSLLAVIAMMLIATAAICQELKLEKVAVTTDSYFRGMSVVDNDVAWVSGSKGTVGRSRDGGKTWRFIRVKGHEDLEFRSLYAFDSLHAVIANAGSPAIILRTIDGGRSWKQAYVNSAPEAFIDGVDFWNDKEGVFYGDAIRGRMLIVKTKDGGMTWSEPAEKLRPELKEGEGSFAASGTNVRCLPSGKTFIATGGRVSRIFISDDFASTWSVVNPPVIQGKTMTGIFSVGFRDERYGILVGGDYEVDTLKKDHIYITTDGGKTWKAPKTPTGGIRECVEFINNDLVISAGYPGVDISRDGGDTWEFLSNEKRFSVVRKARRGELIVLAGQGKIFLLRAK